MRAGGGSRAEDSWIGVGNLELSCEDVSWRWDGAMAGWSGVELYEGRYRGVIVAVQQGGCGACIFGTRCETFSHRGLRKEAFAR